MALDFDAIKRKLERLSGNTTSRNVMWKPEEGQGEEGSHLGLAHRSLDDAYVVVEDVVDDSGFACLVRRCPQFGDVLPLIPD